MTELRPNSQVSFASLRRYYDLGDIFFFVSIYIYSDMMAPATRQNVIELIDLQFKNIRALEIIIMSLAGFS